MQRSGSPASTAAWSLAICGLLLPFPRISEAVDLKNEDSKTYKVGVHERSFTTWTSVSGGTTIHGICPECRIEIVGLGTVRASGSDVVVIRNGALDIEEGP